MIFAACRLCDWLGRRVGQIQVVSEMVPGVLLGPSLFGLIAPEAQARLIPEDAARHRNGQRRDAPPCSSSTPLSQLGLVLYMFLIRMEFNHRPGRRLPRRR